MDLKSFNEILTNTSKTNRSVLCVGIDPDPLFGSGNRILELNRIIVEATSDLACAYKLNLAGYEAMGLNGVEILLETIYLIRTKNPDMPIIGDAKRGDIGNSSAAYSRALFDQYKFDAVTVNPYMGYDSLEPFLERRDKGIFILCHTSNKGGQEIQDLMVLEKGMSEARPLFEVIASFAAKWDKYGNVGLVMGATYPRQIGQVRKICPNMVLLIPGVGFQGGDMEETVTNAVGVNGLGFVINVSRQIMYAAKTESGDMRAKNDIVKEIRLESLRLRDQLNHHIVNKLGENVFD